MNSLQATKRFGTNTSEPQRPPARFACRHICPTSPDRLHGVAHLNLRRLKLRLQSEVRVLEVPPHAEAAEAYALFLHGGAGKVRCLLAKTDGRETGTFLALYRLQHLQLGVIYIYSKYGSRLLMLARLPRQ